ncbi:MAG: MFS transporter [Rhodocyclaceae bacterium]|nr:MFS transporter [Rhodocyclaceae bacterium]
MRSDGPHDQADPAGGRLPTLLSAGLFCALLASYYLIRPLRDELAVQAGVGQLPWTFTATFLTMLAAVPIYGWLLGRWPTRRVLPGVYLFFAASLLAFAAALDAPGLAPLAGPAFFVWASVFNLFVVSVFWSLMADLHDEVTARRHFGRIAAGGSLGAIAGPILALALTRALGNGALLPAAAGLLVVAAGLVVLLRQRAGPARGGREILGGHPLNGLRALGSNRYLAGIGLWLLLYSSLSTLLYFAQTDIVGRAIADRAARTELFATMDLAVNTLTLTGQVLLTGRLMSRVGSGLVLALLPLVSLLGFGALGLWPTLAVIVAVQILRRSTNFALSRPARETLFTVVSPEDRFKAKGAIDTVVYRGGDALSGWLHGALSAIGLGLASISALAIPLAGVWLWLSISLGRAQRRLADTQEAPP